MDLTQALLREFGINLATLVLAVVYLSRRLQRIEIALFGEKDEPSLKERLRKIETQVTILVHAPANIPD